MKYKITSKLNDKVFAINKEKAIQAWKEHIIDEYSGIYDQEDLDDVIKNEDIYPSKNGYYWQGIVSEKFGYIQKDGKVGKEIVPYRDIPKSKEVGEVVCLICGNRKMNVRWIIHPADGGLLEIKCPNCNIRKTLMNYFLGE